MSEVMVSVCMITYNHEAFIREAIEGVLMQQTSFPVELVIGEDCSTDRTREICIEYQQKYPDKIRLLLNEKNLGIMPNFIQTLKACTGKYIALCEGDDYWTDPLKLQKQVVFLEGKPEFSLIYSRCSDFYESQKKLCKPKEMVCYENFKDLIQYYTISTLTSCFRSSSLKKYFLEIQPFSKNWLMGDLPLFLFIAAEGKVKFQDENTAVYRVLEESASRSKLLQRQIDFLKSSLEVKLFFMDRYLSGDFQLFNNVISVYVWSFFILWCHAGNEYLTEEPLKNSLKKKYLRNGIKVRFVKFFILFPSMKILFLFSYKKYRSLKSVLKNINIK